MVQPIFRLRSDFEDHAVVVDAAQLGSPVKISIGVLSQASARQPAIGSARKAIDDFVIAAGGGSIHDSTSEGTRTGRGSTINGNAVKVAGYVQQASRWDDAVIRFLGKGVQDLLFSL